MSNYSKLVGLRNVGSYQVSGTPWMTGSGGATGFPAEKVHRHTFPSVTKSVTIICTGGTDIRVAFQNGYTTFSPFTEDGFAGQKTYSASEVTMVNANYITVPASNGSVTFDVKCKEIFLSLNF